MHTKDFLNQITRYYSDEGRELIFEFFISISRFECALKYTTEFVGGGEERVQPNWDKFVKSIAEKYEQNKNAEVNSAVDYIINYPPKLQVLRNGELRWRERPFPENTPEIKKLSQHIRDIRNNLFHGSKFHGRYVEETSRHYKLLKNAIIILNYWLSLSDEVRNNFLQNIR